MAKKRDSVIVNGTAFYASLHTVNKMSGKYSIDLVVDEKTAASLEALGLKAATTRDGKLKQHDGAIGKVFKFSRKDITQKGDVLGAPTVVDAQNNPIGKDVLIGNGSKVNVKITPYEHAFSKDTGLAGGLQAVQVIELVEFAGAKKTEFGNVDGFTVSNTVDSDDSFI